MQLQNLFFLFLQKGYFFRNPENSYLSLKTKFPWLQGQNKEKEKSHVRSSKVCLSLLKCQCPLITKSLPQLIKVNVTESYGCHLIHTIHFKYFLQKNFLLYLKNFDYYKRIRIHHQHGRSFLAIKGCWKSCFSSQAAPKIRKKNVKFNLYANLLIMHLAICNLDLMTSQEQFKAMC